jgi:uncharacterized membrane protein HdeD (DUF308 family)
MLEAMIKNWWLVALRGLIALIVGIILLVMPPEKAALFIVLFIGAYAMVDGIFALVVGIVNKPAHRDRGWLIAEGIIGILAGFAIFSAPLMAAVFLMYFIAFWALFTGIIEIIFAIAQWKSLPDNWLILLAGIISMILGILVLSNMVLGAAMIIVMVAVYLVMFGVLLIAVGFSLKGLPVPPKDE